MYACVHACVHVGACMFENVHACPCMFIWIQMNVQYVILSHSEQQENAQTTLSSKISLKHMCNNLINYIKLFNIMFSTIN